LIPEQIDEIRSRYCGNAASGHSNAAQLAKMFGCDGEAIAALIIK
jgi:hypothetical protein